MTLKPAVKAVAGLALAAMLAGSASAETCRTQSDMLATERDELFSAALSFAKRVQVSDGTGTQAQTIAEYQQNFGSISSAIVSTSQKIHDATLQVDSVYVLDGVALKADDSGIPAQFFCSLNKSTAETDFKIPGLPPGLYGFAIVKAQSASPWQLSFLLRQEKGEWKLAGFYPKALTAAGHDGLWYWTTARTQAKANQPWSAWLYFQEAVNLLRPVGFLTSTHLEKLLAEQTAATPPALSGGISAETPLVVKAKDGTEFRFTGITSDDSLEKDKIELTAHLRVEKNGDAAADRKRNITAMTALLAAYPELRQNFHGVWIFAETGAQGTAVPTEMAMTEIPS